MKTGSRAGGGIKKGQDPHPCTHHKDGAPAITENPLTSEEVSYMRRRGWGGIKEGQNPHPCTHRKDGAPGGEQSGGPNREKSKPAPLRYAQGWGTRLIAKATARQAKRRVRREILRLRPDQSAQRGQGEPECRDSAQNDSGFLGGRGDGGAESGSLPPAQLQRPGSGACVVSRTGEAYDAQARGPDRKFRLNRRAKRASRKFPAEDEDPHRDGRDSRRGVERRPVATRGNSPNANKCPAGLGPPGPLPGQKTIHP